MVRPQLTEVLPVLVVAEDIVVATDQDFVTIQASQCGHGSTVYDAISQVINFVVRFDSFVPCSNHGFVHFLGIVPRTQFGNTVRASESANASVSEMGITY